MATEKQCSSKRQTKLSACPVCQGEIEHGTLSVHGSLASLLVVGASYQHCWFEGRSNKPEIVIGSGEKTRGFRCRTCGFAGCYRPAPPLIGSPW